jgi:hypothetical protein
MWRSAKLRFEGPISFVICGINTAASPQIHTFSPFKFSIQCSFSDLYKIKNRFKKTTFRAVFRQSRDFFVDCGFAICELAHLGVLRICDS